MEGFEVTRQLLCCPSGSHYADTGDRCQVSSQRPHHCLLVCQLPMAAAVAENAAYMNDTDQATAVKTSCPQPI